jgi:hypothetical protein
MSEVENPMGEPTQPAEEASLELDLTMKKKKKKKKVPSK